MLAGYQLRQIFTLLCGAAVAADLVDAKVRVRAIGKPHRRRAPAHLLHGDAMGEIAHSCTAELLLDGDAVEPQRAHLRPKLAREGVGAIDLRRQRRDLRLREAAHAVAQQIDLGTEIEIERGIPVAGHPGPPLATWWFKTYRQDAKAAKEGFSSRRTPFRCGPRRSRYRRLSGTQLTNERSSLSSAPLASRRRV